MALTADVLLDRMRLKRHLGRWRLLSLLLLLILALGFASAVSAGKHSRFSPLRSDYVARVTIDGVITDDRDVTALLETIRTDRHAKAVIVWLDTPGGSAVGGQQLYLSLLKLSHAKPVVAVMRSVAASAGYMAALGADHILAREGTITGSIGVLLEAFEATELAEKIGIRPIVIKSGPYKAAPNPLEKYTPAQAEVLQSMIKDFFDWFVGIVADRRHMPLDTATKLADGRVYTGRQALQNKLIDALGGEDEAMLWLERNRHIDRHTDIKDMKVEKEGNGLFGKIDAGSLLPASPGLVSVWRPNTF
jgi:protease-4